MTKAGPDHAINAKLTGTHIQIIACAGSGKTETMARRVAYLLNHGVQPESIVAFTFTEKAAKELRQRILERSQEICGPSVLGTIGRMYVGTIHAYALQLLQTFAPRYASFDLIEEDALHAWVARHSKRILGTSKWTGLWDSISAFLRDADIIENEARWPKGTDDFSERYREYVELLESHRLLTFGRSIAAAIEELGDATVRNKVHDAVRYLLVDEYQDVNPAQEKLIAKMTGSKTQLCVVGDDDQSIYQWRGSNVRIMQGFKTRYDKVMTTDLGINRRSVPSIVALAADFADTIEPRLEKKIDVERTQPKSARPVRLLTPESRGQEAEIIADAVEAMKAQGWHFGQIAILVRNWSQADKILEAFEARDIPYDCGGGSLLFATELGYLLAAGFLLPVKWDVRRGWRQSHLPEPPTTFDEWVQELGDLLKLSPSRRKRIASWIESFAEEAQGEGTRPASLVGDLYELADGVGIRTWDLADEVKQLNFGTFARFSQVLASFERARLSSRWTKGADGLEYKGGQDRGTYFYSAFAFFLNNYAMQGTPGYVVQPDLGAPAVQVTTIHSAKGLQWPIVFIPGIEKGKLPSKYVGSIADTQIPGTLVSQKVLERYAGSEADERRLFYVAMTRARDLLVMSCPQRANKNRVSPSSFFEFAQNHPQSWSPIDGIGPIPNPKASKPFSPEVPTLTFSELALYGKCPHAFRLSTEFDVATPIVRELGFGKSIHHVLRRIAEEVKATRKIPGNSELDALFASEFHVPYATAAGYQKMKAAARKLVDRYVNEWSSDLRCIWEVERRFELHLGSVIVIGRADVILDRSADSTPILTIVDYKSYEEPERDKTTEDQLRTYVGAARAEGLKVENALLHDLQGSQRLEVSVTPADVKKTTDRAQEWARRIRKGEFPAKPEKSKCRACDYRDICQHAGHKAAA